MFLNRTAPEICLPTEGRIWVIIGGQSKFNRTLGNTYVKGTNDRPGVRVWVTRDGLVIRKQNGMCLATTSRSDETSSNEESNSIMVQKYNNIMEVFDATLFLRHSAPPTSHLDADARTSLKTATTVIKVLIVSQNHAPAIGMLDITRTNG